MREIIKTIRCDRCGKKLTTATYRHSIAIGITKQTNPKDEWLEDFLGDRYGLGGDLKDFCADCAKSFYEWMNQGKKDEKQLGETEKT